MKRLLSILLCLTCLQLSAQQLYFSTDNYKDSARFADSMPALALKVINAYTDADPMDYYDNIFRYAVVAKQYSTAIAYLDSENVINNETPPAALPGIGFQWRAFITAKMQQKDDASFNILFLRYFIQHYHALSSAAKGVVINYTQTDLGELKRNFDGYKQLCAADNYINLEDARGLVRFYNSYTAYTKMLPLMHLFLAIQPVMQ